MTSNSVQSNTGDRQMEQLGFIVDAVQHLQIDPTLVFDRFLSDCI